MKLFAKYTVLYEAGEKIKIPEFIIENPTKPEGRYCEVILRSWTILLSIQDAKELGYDVKMENFNVSDYSYDIENDVIVINIAKYELKDGWNKKKIEKYVKNCFSKNISFDSSIWLTRID